MSFLDLVFKRQSCRAYQTKPVEPEKIIACLEAARLAPSACNSQPWHYVVVDDAACRKSIVGAVTDPGLPLNKFCREVPLFIVVVQEPANLTAKLGGRAKGQDYAPIDLGLSVAQLTLAATEQGLAHCLLGWFSEKKIKQRLNIPRHKKVRLVIAIGYARNERIRAKKRKGFLALASQNEYGKPYSYESARSSSKESQ